MKHMGCFLANPTRTRTRLTTVLQEGGIGFLKLQLGHTFIAVEGNTSAPSKVYWLFLAQIDLGSSLIRLASDKAPNRTQKNIHVQKRGILENTLETHNQWKIIKQWELHAIAIYNLPR